MFDYFGWLLFQSFETVARILESLYQECACDDTKIKISKNVGIKVENDVFCQLRKYLKSCANYDVIIQKISPICLNIGDLERSVNQLLSAMFWWVTFLVVSFAKFLNLFPYCGLLKTLVNNMRQTLTKRHQMHIQSPAIYLRWSFLRK